MPVPVHPLYQHNSLLAFQRQPFGDDERLSSQGYKDPLGRPQPLGNPGCLPPLWAEQHCQATMTTGLKDSQTATLLS